MQVNSGTISAEGSSITINRGEGGISAADIIEGVRTYQDMQMQSVPGARERQRRRARQAMRNTRSRLSS